MVKRLIIFTSLFFFISISLFSQVRLGAKAGLNLSTVTFSDKSNYYGAQLKPGILLGGLMDISISKRFGLTPEIHYSSKGFIYTELDERLDRFDVYYLSLPVLMYYKPHNIISFYVGPEISKNIAFKNKPLGAHNHRFIPNSFEVGIDIGLRVNFLKSMLIDARYQHGISESGKLTLIDLFQINQGTTSTYNRVFQLTLGYLF